MDTDEIDKLEGRELDRAVAREVFKWKGSGSVAVPEFSADATADYDVLCEVREEWSSPRKSRFVQALGELQAARDGYADPLHYQIGDYARAALRATRATKEHPHVG